MSQVLSIRVDEADLALYEQETEQGRGIHGVIDGLSPKGIEGPEELQTRQSSLRQIGDKLG